MFGQLLQFVQDLWKALAKLIYSHPEQIEEGEQNEK